MTQPKRIKGRDIVDSHCNGQRYRYLLWQEHDDIAGGKDNHICWVMLNPAKADLYQDDNTVCKVIKFSNDCGYKRVAVLNLIPIYAPDTEALKNLSKCNVDIAGDWNTQIECMKEALRGADKVVLARGNPDSELLSALNLAKQQLIDCLREAKQIGNTFCITTTKARHPRHPAYYDIDCLYPFIFP